MLNRAHNLNVDYFALGVIGFECMTGKRPYKGKDKNKIRDKMLEGQVNVKVEKDWDDYP